MIEQCSSTEVKEPVKRVKGLPEVKQCLKYPGYECNCRMSDPVLRRTTLRKLRQELGVYSFLNLLDCGVADANEEARRLLCEGEPPTLWQRFKDFLNFRII